MRKGLEPSTTAPVWLRRNADAKIDIFSISANYFLFFFLKPSSFCVPLRPMTSTNIQKTNAARLLDAAGISYELVPYEVDENNLAADHVAAQLGEPIEQVFKTLVLRGDRNGLFVCVMPGDMEVDLKVAAKISGNKSAAMIHMKELLPETGYIRGGCSPIGMKKPLPTFIFESALLYDYIYISAGIRGLQLKINPQVLVDYTRAGIYPL